MKINLRSKRLAQLFTEVWEHLPAADRVLLSERTKQVVDNPNFLPRGQIPTWGAAISIRVRKSIAIVYLSPRKLPRQSDDFVRYVIAHELAHIFCRHTEQLFLSPLNDSTTEKSQKGFESRADEQVRVWGFPIVSPQRMPKRSQPPRKGGGSRKI